MYSWTLFKSRIEYLKILIPRLTIRKLWNLSICFLSYITGSTTSSKVPAVWVIILTYKCNYKCIMCQKSSVDDNPYKHPASMNYTYIEALIIKHHKDISLIQLIGGEPLLYPEFKKVIELLHRYNIGYFITTNGYLLNSEISDLITGKCLWVSFSLDAATPELYKKIRVGGSIEDISSNIKQLNRFKKLSRTNIPLLNANSTLFTYNLNDIETLLEFCADHDIQSLSIGGGRLYNTPKVNSTHLLRNQKEYSVSVIERAKQVAKGRGINMRVALRSLYGTKETRVKNKPTLSSYLEITIQPDFAVVAAGNEYMYMGNLSVNSVEEIWNGEESYVTLRRNA